MKKTRLFLTMLLAAGVLAGCSGKSEAPAASEAGTGSGTEAPAGETAGNAAVKDEVIAVLKGEPSNIDPHGNTELVAMTTQVQIFETLVKKDEEGNIVPGLAESWEQIDDKTIRFKLRDNVYFHNGEKLTAEDVAYTIKRATEKPSSASIFASFDADNTKAVDELTVDVTTKAPFAAVYNYLTSTRGGIVSKKAVEEMGDDQFGRSPVGTGPFAFDSWVSGTNITLKRNDNYWGEKPAYSTLTLKFITETANRALEIESGNADIVLDPDTGDLDRLAETDGLKVVSGDSYGMSYIVFSMDDEVLGDVRIRQALSMALDLDSLVETVYGSYATVSESVMPSTVFAYKSQGKHEYNIEKAKELLEEAGYADGLTIELNLPNGSEQQNIGVIAQNMWKEIGVTANISTASTSEIIAAGRRGDNQVTIMAATYSTGDPGHALADFDTRSDGFFRPVDKKIDELLDKGSAAYDSKERAAVYEELQDYIYHQYYMIGVANKTVNYVITDQVENFYCDPGNIPSFAGVTVAEQ
ncbi:ABC transporter substrate-binding protein [Clostridium transplantifaecale]|uniref:ABC transporter substrate-binding protein n=1 Tax=Clostridium transplantifaecale TaxID=2479838 RepID=UPI000F635DDA|nr:ABC transporter substrate-binding protein [Clostridium transplantifaecale]